MCALNSIHTEISKSKALQTELQVCRHANPVGCLPFDASAVVVFHSGLLTQTVYPVYAGVNAHTPFVQGICMSGSLLNLYKFR
jgi:hypothetical protein